MGKIKQRKEKEQKTTTPEMLNTTAAAEYLGIKKTYLYKLMYNRAVTFYRPFGKVCYFRREDLDQLLMRNRVDSAESLNNMAADYAYTARRAK